MNKAKPVETNDGIEFNSIELKNGDVYMYDIDTFVQIYESEGKLPIPMILCSRSEVARTCFGKNLQNQVAKAGGIRNLLENYVCIDVRRADARAAKEAAKASADAQPAAV